MGFISAFKTWNSNRKFMASLDPAMREVFKQSLAGGAFVSGGANNSVEKYTKWDFRAAAIEGYEQNCIAFAAIIDKATDAASIPLKFTDGDNELEEGHPLRMLLNSPNKETNLVELRTAFHIEDNIYGNVFIESVPKSGASTDRAAIESIFPKDGFKELYIQQAYKMKINVDGSSGEPVSYNIDDEGGSLRNKWPWEKGTTSEDRKAYKQGRSNIYHIKRYNPTDRYYGLSPLQPCARSLNLFNLVYQWNLALCENSGRIDGLVHVAGQVGPKALEDLERKWKAFQSGPANAGRQFVHTNEMKFTPISVNPKDVDWTEGKDAASRDIARSLKMPTFLLGIPGDNTYSNQEAAMYRYYNSTIIPEAQKFCDMVNEWLAPSYGENIKCTLDVDNWQPLEGERIARAKEIDEISYLTANEKRELAGHEPYDSKAKDPADQILVDANKFPINDLSGGAANALSIQANAKIDEMAEG